MGKSKWNWKDKGAKRRAVDESEERRKMKETVLKVFQARALSPGGGGAVLVNDKSSCQASKPTAVRRTQPSHQAYKHKTRSSLSSSSSDTAEEGSLRESRKRKRHRKTITGQESKSNDSKAGVGQHIKAAHTYSYSRAGDAVKHRGLERTDGISNITRSRLTRNVGLFNPGKKSSTVVRDPIPVPESVQRDVDRTLQHILGHDDKTENRSSKERNWASGAQPASGGSQHEDHTVDLHTPASSLPDHAATQHNRRSPGTLHSSHRSSEQSASSDHSSSTELGQVLPKVPTMEEVEEIAVRMMSELESQTEKTFTGRGLLAETCVDLKKMLQQNQRTPEVRVPTSHHADSSLSARRSLISSFPLMGSDSQQQRPRTIDVLESTTQDRYSAQIYPSSSNHQHQSGRSLSQGSAPLEPALNLFGTSDNSFAIFGSSATKEATDLRGESDSMELNPFHIGSSDLDIDDSAITLLRCNSMISKITKNGESRRAQVDDGRLSYSKREGSLHQTYAASHVDPRGDHYSAHSQLYQGRARHGHDSFLDRVMGHTPLQQARNQCHTVSRSDLHPRSQILPQKAQTYSPSYEILHSDASFTEYKDQDLLDHLDAAAESGLDTCAWDAVRSGHEHCSVTQEYNRREAEWEHADFLRPLRKPTLDTPSPPRKLSPHNLY